MVTGLPARAGACRESQPRECGKYVFWRKPDRKKGYISEYWKKLHSEAAKEPVISK